MKCTIFGLVLILVSGVILETSARPASQAIQVRRRRNRNNAGQRRIYLARQAAPLALPQQQQQSEIFEEELPTALTETDFTEPNQRIIDGQSQRLIGTGLGSFFTNKQTLLGLLASTTTTTTTTVAPTTTATGTITGTITLTPTAAPTAGAAPAPAPGPNPGQDPIAPSSPFAQRAQQSQVFMRPVGAGAYGPLVIRRRHGQGGGAHRRRQPIQVVRRGGNGGQVIRVPIPIRLSTGEAMAH